MDRAMTTFQTGSAIAPLVPTTFEDVQRQARLIVASGFAPKDSSEAQVMGSILKGLELGVPPMQAVQGIAMINGRPAIWGDLMMALVARSPICEEIEEVFEGAGDDMVAVCRARRVGRTNPIERRFSVADAKRAGLWQTQAKVTRRGQGGSTYEKDNDSPWYRFPKRMLQMRARALCLRDAFPDVLSGLASADEMQDEAREMRDITPQEPRNPLVDPPAMTQHANGNDTFVSPQVGLVDIDDQPEDGARIIEAQAVEDMSQDDGSNAEEAAAAPDDGFPGDQPTPQPVGIEVGGLQVPPPSDAVKVTDFVAYLDALTKATTIEGIMGAAANVRATVEMLPEPDRGVFNVAYGFRKGEISGTPTPGEPIAKMRAWALAQFRSAE